MAFLIVGTAVAVLTPRYTVFSPFFPLFLVLFFRFGAWQERDELFIVLLVQNTATGFFFFNAREGITDIKNGTIKRKENALSLSALFFSLSFARFLFYFFHSLSFFRVGSSIIIVTLVYVPSLFWEGFLRFGQAGKTREGTRERREREKENV